MKSNNVNSQKGIKKSEDIKPDREVLREPGQISFKDAIKKAVNTKLKSKNIKNG